MRNGLLIKGIILVFSFIIILGVLPSCSRVNMLDSITNRDDKAFSEMLDKVFVALDNNDKEGLKALFAVSSIKENTNLDDQINAFFKAYKGPLKKEHIKLLLHSSESIERGKRKTELSGGGKDIIITADGIRYYVRMMMCSQDDFNKDNEGIHILEFDTENAYNSQYFVSYKEEDDGPGLYYQNSADKRDDIRWIDGRSWKYKYYDRKLTADMLKAAAEKNDDFNNFISVIGEPNCSWTVFEYYYYELDNGMFAVCKLDHDVRPRDSSGHAVKPNSIVAIYIADEKDDIKTVWTAEDIVKVHGGYKYFRPVERELSEDYFRTFVTKSHSLSKLKEEIGAPNTDETWYCYYKLADNRFVGCHYSGDDIEELFIADSNDKLYTIWEAKSSDDE